MLCINANLDPFIERIFRRRKNEYQKVNKIEHLIVNKEVENDSCKLTTMAVEIFVILGLLVSVFQSGDGLQGL